MRSLANSLDIWRAIAFERIRRFVKGGGWSIGFDVDFFCLPFLKVGGGGGKGFVFSWDEFGSFT